MPTTQICRKSFWKDYLEGASETLDLVLDKVGANNPLKPNTPCVFRIVIFVSNISVKHQLT